MKMIDDEVVASDAFLSFRTRSYIDRNGNRKTWSYVERHNHREAVVVVPVTRESRSLIIIRQFRIPFAADVFEFPAGLVDEGETPEATAVRELAEETGYRGTVRHIGPAVSSSAGLTTERVTMVYMDVDEQPAAASTPEGSEQIEVIRIAPAETARFLEEVRSSGAIVDAKLYIYLNERHY